MKPQTVELKEYTSLNIGGEATMVVVKNEDDLQEAVSYAKAKGLRIHILGSGTNTYFGRDLKDMLVIKNEIVGIQYSPQADVCFMEIGAGEIWDDIVKAAVEKKLWGIENLSYIPGTVGAAPVQNIGAYGMELKDTFISLRAYDFSKNVFVELSREECIFGYRDSVFKHVIEKYCIVSITLQLSIKPNPILTYKPLDTLMNYKNITLQDIRNLVIETRNAKLPDYKLYPNAGSFFKNPIVGTLKAENLRSIFPGIPLIQHGEAKYKVPAAWLIEHVANMKGVKMGNIGSWPNQPLVLVNYGQGEASELELFADSIIDTIYEKVGIHLEKEVNYIN